MDKKLTNKEIVKALEICQKPHDNDTCNNCKYKRNFGCRDALCNDILNLINRLQGEAYKECIEKVKEIVVDSVYLDELDNILKELVDNNG